MPGSPRANSSQEEQKSTLPKAIYGDENITERARATRARMQTGEYRDSIGATSDCYRGATEIFREEKIPLGLMEVLIECAGDDKDNKVDVHIKVDDSTSMNGRSNLLRSKVTPHMLDEMKGKRDVTRWDEAQDRIHKFINLLSFVPTGPITLSFLNNSRVTVIKRIDDKNNTISLEDFIRNAHDQIRKHFSGLRPDGYTPIYDNLVKMLNTSSRKTINYILTDGEPNTPTDSRLREVFNTEQEIGMIKKLLQERKNPENHPVAILCCSDQPLTWLDEISHYKYFAAIQNLDEDMRVVTTNQGQHFINADNMKGLWLMRNVAAAINCELYSVHRPVPLSKSTLELLFGRVYSEHDYRTYFSAHQSRATFENDFPLFLTAKTAAEIRSVQVFETSLAKDGDVTNASTAVFSDRRKHRKQPVPSPRMYQQPSQSQPQPSTPPESSRCKGCTVS